MSEQHWFGIKSTKIINFLSGLTAGVISVTICNPLDIARTRLNVLVLSLIPRTLPAIKKIMASTCIFLMLCRRFGKSRVCEVFTMVRV